MTGVIVVGAQWGDEGKGKIVDILTEKASLVVRAQGGNNAGHTILIDGNEHKLHLVPSGILRPHTRCLIGPGTVIDPEVLLLEVSALEAKGIPVKERLVISSGAHVIFPYHRLLDHLMERTKGRHLIGTTGRGIGPCYADKTNRIGIRLGDLTDPAHFAGLLREAVRQKNEEFSKIYHEKPLSFDEILEQYTYYGQALAPMLGEVEEEVNAALERKEKVLFEGAQGTFLDTTFGTYPFVTSSSTLSGGICAGVGVGPSKIGHTLGVIKAYTTRVGNGPMPTEFVEEEAKIDHHKIREMGSTTQRKRRIGWFDSVMMKTAIRLNGLQSLAVTKLDVLDTFETLKICTAYQIGDRILSHFPLTAHHRDAIIPLYEEMPGWKTPTTEISSYEDLPVNAKNYLRKIEELAGIPISILSLGPERKNTIEMIDVFSQQRSPQ